MKVFKILLLALFISNFTQAQTVKILFNANKAESAGNADWVIDADLYNLGYSTGPAVVAGGSESNPQIAPTPLQSTVTATTSETYWNGALSAWGIDLVKKGYGVETLPYNGKITFGDATNLQDLSKYKVFIDCEPNILYTAAEKTAIIKFVQAGGGLFMVSDHDVSDRNNDTYDSPHIWNDLLSNNGIQANPFGITFDYANFSQTTSNIPSLPTDPLLHGIMGNVTQAMWSNGTSMSLSTAANASVKGVVYMTGSAFGTTSVMVAYATYGNGRVVAIGDSSPCDDGTGDSGDALYNGWTTDAAGNHERLIMNASIWLASGSTTPSAPTATSVAATSITTTGALLNGTVLANNLSSTVTFNYGTTTSYGNTVSATPAAVSGTTSTAVTSTLSGLTANTLYHYRVAATNTLGTTYGSDLTFTTLSGIPTATTNAATSVTLTGAALNGTVNAGSLSTTVTFNYGTSTSYGTTVSATPATVTGSTSTAVTSTLSGLTANTLYHYRVVATNTAGTTYGSDLTFTTISGIPTATSAAATSITSTEAVLNGAVNAGSLSTTVTFNYGTSTSYGKTVSATPGTATGSASTAVTSALSGLTANTLYHFRVVAANTAGTTYGSDLTFTTLSAGCIDIFEPNATQAVSKAITVNADNTATISSSSDIDWFKFSNTTATTKIKVTVTNIPTGTDYDLKLYNASGTQIGSSTNTGTSPETILYNTTVVGSYYIKVFPWSGYSATCYTFNASLSNVNFKSLEVAADISKEALSVLIYPNPASDNVHLQLNAGTNTQVAVRLVDMLGHQWLTKQYDLLEGENDFSLDVSNLKKGLYFIEVLNSNERIFKKLIVGNPNE